LDPAAGRRRARTPRLPPRAPAAREGGKRRPPGRQGRRKTQSRHRRRNQHTGRTGGEGTQARHHRRGDGARAPEGPEQTMNPAKRLEIFRRFKQANPKPTTELEYTTPFELLIAVLLSAQATDVGVNKATRKLYPVANSPQAMLD